MLAAGEFGHSRGTAIRRRPFVLIFDESETIADEVSCTVTLVAQDERGTRVDCRVPYPVLLRICARSGIRRRSALEAYGACARVLHATLDARWERGATEPDGGLLLRLDDIEEPAIASRIGPPYPRGMTGFPVDLAKARGPFGWMRPRSTLSTSR